jgi:hypothetical protein
VLRERIENPLREEFADERREGVADRDDASLSRRPSVRGRNSKRA